MKILSIETSCDESGIAIIETTDNSDVHVLSNQLSSQAALHAEYGGVFPTLAKREHARTLVPLMLQALTEAKMLTPTSQKPPQEIIGSLMKLLEREQELFVHLTMLFAQYARPDIDAIAVTYGPGLEPALWVGVNFAKALSIVWNIPIVAVNHMEGHIYATLYTEKEKNRYVKSPVTLPLVALLISGGHTELLRSDTLGTYTLLGATRDDAVGEAFDKTARLLGLPYPGGPEVSRLAVSARDENLDQPFVLPRPMISSQDLAFSFSGLKTAVLRLTQELHTISETNKKQIAREIEDAITEVLVTKTKRALEETGARTLIVSGGVSANTTIVSGLRTMLAQQLPDVTLAVSPKILATDNALMIAFAGISYAERKQYVSIEALRANGNASLSSIV